MAQYPLLPQPLLVFSLQVLGGCLYTCVMEGRDRKVYVRMCVCVYILQITTLSLSLSHVRTFPHNISHLVKES